MCAPAKAGSTSQPSWTAGAAASWAWPKPRTWKPGSSNKPVEQALTQALGRRGAVPGCLHHSDRGSQYASARYRGLVAQAGLVASMSRAGNCYDNAAMESFWGKLKSELVPRQDFATRQAARLAIFEYVEVFYNRTRLHRALGFKSPVDFELQLN